MGQQNKTYKIKQNWQNCYLSQIYNLFIKKAQNTSQIILSNILSIIIILVIIIL